MSRIVAAVALLALTGAACAGEGVRPASGVVTPAPTVAPAAAPTTTATTPSTTTTTTAPVRVTLAFSGDLLSHSPVFSQARRNGGGDLTHDYRPMFRLVRDTLSAADLAICHLETPLSVDDTDLSGYPTFAAPRELAVAIADAGYDGCSTASNHSYDRGPAGVTSTLDLLDAAGLGHAGMARSADEAATPTLYDLDGITIGHLSWTYGLNGFVLPDDRPWLVDVTDPDAILAEAAAARAAGADFVVLSIQWGAEYRTDPTPDQEALARTLLGSPDLDLIVGSHAHVVQPLEEIDGEYVLYGLGNFLSNQSANCCPARTQNGVVVRFTVEGTEDAGFAVTGIEAVPTRVDRSDYTILPLPRLLVTDLDPAVREVYRAALEDTREILTRRGVDVGL